MRILASILAALLLSASAYATQASDAFAKARKLEKAGKVVEAYVLYAEAAAREPKNTRYTAKAAEMQQKAAREQLKNVKQGVPPAPPATVDPAPPATLALAPDPDIISISAREAESARQALPPAQLKLATGRFDFHLTGTAIEVFNQVAQRCGLQTVLDSEYQATASPRVRFDIDDVDCRDAIRATEAATGSFVVPLSTKLMLISKDTPAKRQANEQTMSIVLSIPTALTTQDLTEISQAIKQVSGIEKLAWSAATNEIIIRDRVSRVMVARPLVEQLTAHRAGVLFDLRFLQLTDNEMISFGIDLTNSINFIFGADPAIALAGGPLNQVIRALLRGSRSWGVTGISADVVATMTENSSRTVLRTELRSLNGFPATLHVGDKYPILTSGYYGPSAVTSNPAAYAPPPSFTYQDLGVSLKVLPVVGNNDLITLDVESEYQLLAGQALNGIPVLASRRMATRISIHNDEWAVIGGLMDKVDTKSINGVAGLARIPWLGWLFRTETREKDRAHIVIVMRPHILGDPPSENETSPMRVGTETRPLSPI